MRSGQPCTAAWHCTHQTCSALEDFTCPQFCHQDPGMGSWCHVDGTLAHSGLRWCKSWLLAIDPAVCRVESWNVAWPLVAAIRANPRCKTGIAWEWSVGPDCGRTAMEGGRSLAQESKMQGWLKRAAFHLRKKEEIKKSLCYTKASWLPVIKSNADVDNQSRRAIFLLFGAVEPSFFSLLEVDEGWWNPRLQVCLPYIMGNQTVFSNCSIPPGDSWREALIRAIALFM